MSASAMATYAYGAAKIGYSRAVKVLAKTANTHTASVQQYNQDNMSISYLVNDSLSVSFVYLFIVHNFHLVKFSL
jgi:orotidine-5'-phosphate decarboxylase